MEGVGGEFCDMGRANFRFKLSISKMGFYRSEHPAKKSANRNFISAQKRFAFGLTLASHGNTGATRATERAAELRKTRIPKKYKIFVALNGARGLVGRIGTKNTKRQEGGNCEHVRKRS
jgi:hypothetical protein